MLKTGLLWILVMIAVTDSQLNQNWQVDQSCVTPDNFHGSCQTLSYCPQVVNIYRRTNQDLAQRYVLALQRICGTRNIRGDPVICCLTSRNEQSTEATQRNPFFPQEVSQHPTQATFSQKPLPRENPFLSSQPHIPTTTTRTLAPVPTTKATPVLDVRGPSCQGPDSKLGQCVEIKSCPELLNQLMARQRDARFIQFLRNSRTICGNLGHQVCCPNGENLRSRISDLHKDTDEGPRRLPNVEEGCGASPYPISKPYVVGGEESRRPGDWPWIALLGYDDGSFKCGGSLITARHVLTAAHCIRKDLSFVRLGEYDLSTDTETPHVDINVTRYVAHPDYSRWNGRSDLAMLYLERNVEFTKTILPICLPKEDNLRHKSYVDYWPFVAGWGKLQEGGEEATVLNELRLPVQKNEVCLEKYREHKRYRNDNQFDSAVLCAGELTGGKDTCQGDSGGPLMVNELYQNQVRFYLIGVVSYGIGCARKDVPGVYASTQYFMDWIIARVQEAP